MGQEIECTLDMEKAQAQVLRQDRIPDDILRSNT